MDFIKRIQTVTWKTSMCTMHNHMFTCVHIYEPRTQARIQNFTLGKGRHSSWRGVWVPRRSPADPGGRPVWEQRATPPRKLLGIRKYRTSFLNIN